MVITAAVRHHDGSSAEDDGESGGVQQSPSAAKLLGSQYIRVSVIDEIQTARRALTVHETTTATWEEGE